jgi:hypothetical protein
MFIILPPRLPFMRPKHLLREEKRAPYIYIHHPVPFVRRHVHYIHRLGDAGIVYQDIYPSELFFHIVDKRGDAPGIAYVKVIPCRACACAGQRPGLRLGAGFIYIGNNNICLLAGQRLRLSLPMPLAPPVTKAFFPSSNAILQHLP